MKTINQTCDCGRISIIHMSTENNVSRRCSKCGRLVKECNVSKVETLPNSGYVVSVDKYI